MKPLQLVALLVLISCDFEPEEEVFTKIAQPTTEGLSIVLENVTGETIQLKEKTTFHYSIETGDKRLLESVVRLNNELIWTTTSASTSFDLDPENLASGTYTLDILFLTTSESGSLAEKYGAEVLYLWLRKNVVVDHNVPSEPSDPGAITITSIENTDNTIWVHWKGYNNFNFQWYQLERTDFDANGNIVGGAVFSVQPDSAQTLQHDYLYVGGRSEYKIKLMADGTVYTSPPVSYEHPYKPELSYTMEGNGAVKIFWNSLGSLSGNFHEYEVEIRETTGLAEPVTFEMHSVSDTSITFNPQKFNFGSIKNMSLTIFPSEKIHLRKHYGQLIYGSKFPVFDNTLRFNTNDDNFYSTKQLKPFKVSGYGNALDSIDHQYDWTVFNNINTGIARGNNKTYRIDLQTMNVVEELNLGDAVQYIYGVSDDNKLLIQTETGAKVITLNGNLITALSSAAIPNGYSGISPDGKYAIFSDRVYKFNGTQYEEWNILQTHFIKSVDFLPDEPTKAIIGYSDKVVKYDIETNMVDVESSFHTGPCNYDPVSNKVGCHMGNYFAILESSNLQEFKFIPVNYGVFYLFNESLLCASGSQIKLSELP